MPDTYADQANHVAVAEYPTMSELSQPQHVHADA